MKKVLGVFVAIIILWLMSGLMMLAEVIGEKNGLGSFLKLIPIFLAIWLIKISWSKITTEKRHNNE